MRVQIGIDWARHEAVARLGCDGRTRTVKVVRSLAGVADLWSQAKALGGEDAEVDVCIEAGDPGICAALHARGARVFVQDAKQARRFAESLGSSGAKDDARDAESLRQMLDSPRHCAEPWTPPEALREVAGVLLDDHDDVESKKRRAINQLREGLVKAHPALERALREIWLQSSLLVIERAPTWQHGVALSDEERAKLLAGCKFQPARRQAVADALAEPWVELPAAVVDVHAARIRRLVAELRQLLAQQAEIDRALERLASEAPAARTLRTTPGVGAAIAVGLLALGAESLVHGERDDLIVWCGAAPVLRQSGKSQHVTRMRKSAPIRGRRTTYLVAMQAIRRLAWAKAQYAYLRARGKPHGTALRIIARSLIRLLGALLRTGEPYDEAKYLASLRARDVAWARALAQPDPEDRASDGAPGAIDSQPAPPDGLAVNALAA